MNNIELDRSIENEFNDEELKSIKGSISLNEDFDLKSEIRKIIHEKHMINTKKKIT